MILFRIGGPRRFGVETLNHGDFFYIIWRAIWQIRTVGDDGLSIHTSSLNDHVVHDAFTVLAANTPVHLSLEMESFKMLKESYRPAAKVIVDPGIARTGLARCGL